MHQQRIKLTDTISNIMIKMFEGNPGAVEALVNIINADNVDPDALMGTLDFVLMLDVFGIYGTDIYVLYSDICNRDVVKMMAVIKATQLGLFNRSVLKDAAHRQDYSGRTMVPVDDLYNKIKELYPSFDVK